MQLFTEMNLTVLISDVDTVWLRSPFEYMKRYPAADILTSSDHLAPTTTDGGLENGVLASAAYNIGIMMFSPRSREFARAWVEWIERDDDVWDQNAFNTCAALSERTLGAISLVVHGGVTSGSVGAV